METERTEKHLVKHLVCPELTNTTIANSSLQILNLTTYPLNACIFQPLWTKADTESEQLNNKFERVWQRALLHVPPVVALVGLALNLCVILLMPRRAVRVSRMAKYYYLVSAVGDILIMLKILAVFTIQTSCQFRLVGLCKALGSYQITWKVLRALLLIK